MMKPKVIKTEEIYKATLARIDELMDAEPGSDAFDELELLAMLVNAYEDEVYPVDLPDPVEAIKFRMDQQGLKPKDLVPLLGSRGKVSEVLSGKRKLSLTMMRNLHTELGIPAEVLLQEPGSRIPQPMEGIDWSKFPLNEMIKRNWLGGLIGSLAELKVRTEEILSGWATPLGQGALEPALLRQHVRDGGKADGYSLTAWKIRVSLLALEQDLPAYKPGTVTQRFIQDLVGLSYLDDGPRLAQEYLHKNGIYFMVEPHLPHTHLDGAAIRMPDGAPLIALTLRYDRLDNFWFTLCHELAHVALHFDGEAVAFFDDLDQGDVDALETEADHWAADALIPSEEWRAAGLGYNPSAERVRVFAAALRINPVIPFGRIQKETGDYKRFGKIVSRHKIRHFWT